MTKSELIKKVSEQTGVEPKDTEKVVSAVIANVIAGVLADGKVEIAGLGKFEKKHREARNGRNPITGEAIKIAASNAVAFKAAKAFKDSIN